MVETAGSGKFWSLVGAGRKAAAADPLFAAAILTWVLSLFTFFVPSLDPLYLKYSVTPSEFVLLAFAIVLFLRAAYRAEKEPARNFWLLIATGFSCWMLGKVSAIWSVVDDGWDPTLVVDVFYLGYFVFIVVAVELRLEARNYPLWRINYGTSAVTGVLLLLAVFSYFSLVPYLAGTTVYSSYSHVYAAFDVYLAGRFIVASVQTAEVSWSRMYRTLSLAFVLVAIVDVISWLYEIEWIEYRRSNVLNIFWHLWCPAAFFASRIQLRSTEVSAPFIQKIYPAANVLLVFGLALPVMHLAGYSFAYLDAASARPRTIFVFCWVLVIAVILLVFHWLMRGRILELIKERELVKEIAEGLQRQLERTMRMGTLGRLSAGLAHDFGNTLMAVGMHARVIEREDDIGKIDRRDIDAVSTGVRYAQDLVDKLREFGSTSTSLPAAPLDIAAEAESTLQLVTASLNEGVSLSFESDQAAAMAMAGKADVHRVLINYLYNAIDAIGEAGNIRVSVTAGKKAGECASCAARFSGEFVTLSVADDGHGVDPALLGELFEPLITSKAQGSGGGLGLAAVHGIVHRLGGHVGLETSRTEGSCFSAHFVAATTGSREPTDTR